MNPLVLETKIPFWRTVGVTLLHRPGFKLKTTGYLCTRSKGLDHYPVVVVPCTSRVGGEGRGLILLNFLSRWKCWSLNLCKLHPLVVKSIKSERKKVTDRELITKYLMDLKDLTSVVPNYGCICSGCERFGFSAQIRIMFEGWWRIDIVGWLLATLIFWDFILFY